MFVRRNDQARVRKSTRKISFVNLSMIPIGELLLRLHQEVVGAI